MSLSPARTFGALDAPTGQNSRGFALCILFVATMGSATGVRADSGSHDLATATGDDPTQPFGKIELLDRFTEAPGPGVAPGTNKQVETNTPFVRIEAPFGSRRSGS